MKTESSVLCFVVLVFVVLPQTGQAADSSEFFKKQVRPIFTKNCLPCHAEPKMGGLQVTSRETLLTGGNSGPAIVPGSAEKSLLLQAVKRTHERLKMPPQEKLATKDIAALESWITDGAVWAEEEKSTASTAEYIIPPEQRDFWSFQPVKETVAPAVKNMAWMKSPIDAFILHKLEAEGLKPAEAADKRTLIRRATIDLHGLPPTPEEVGAFLKDDSPDAFARVVDRLLASPRYGERWGRYWLDVARYSDDQLDATRDLPFESSFRYRDWVVQAFNKDMPYDRFIKAQLAGDLIDPSGELAPGLGFYALSPNPEFNEDRVDATSRGFLGLTVACAQCHNHKYDPIPTIDYYSMLGVFESTETYEVPLVGEAEVKLYTDHKKLVDDQEAAIKGFLDRERRQLEEVLAAQTATYVSAACEALGVSQASLSDNATKGLDPDVVQRWLVYLRVPRQPREHPYLADWDRAVQEGASAADCRKIASQFQDQVVDVLREKHRIDEKNVVILAEARVKGDKSPPVLSLSRDKFFLLRDLTRPPSKKGEDERRFAGGVLYYSDEQILQHLPPSWKSHLATMQAHLSSLQEAMPAKYPFFHAIRDKEKPANISVRIGGDKENLGEEAPRRFLAILSEGEASLFTDGSGRLELANAIADPGNPLTARVMVNRIWQYHFGKAIVRTPGNFGRLGERPTHPELLDYLATRFVSNGWSIKALHREIMLSASYGLSSEFVANNHEVDPDNRLLWRANTRRLDLEALRDSILFVSGTLDLSLGGPPVPISQTTNNRRTVYGFVSRRKPNRVMSLFDFPDANSCSVERITTNTPLQQLFLLNSEFMLQQAEALTGRVAGSNAERVTQMYRLLYGRVPTKQELQLAESFLQTGSNAWPEYAQVLLSSNEFLYIP